MEQLLLLIFAVSVFIFVRNLVYLIFGISNIRTYKKRLAQLKFEEKTEDKSLERLIEATTKPIIEVVLPKLNMFDYKKTAQDIKHAKWNIEAKQFIALKLLAKALGVGLLLILSSINQLPVGVMWGSLLFFLPQMLLTNSANNRRESIMLEFPDFIRITQGFLTANLTFEQAVAETIPFMKKDWQGILRGFLSRSQAGGLNDALEYMKEEIGTIEVREFISLVNLTLEQGRDAKESYEAQAEKIQQMIQDMMMVKIGRREIYGIIIQAPLLLCNIAVIGLPVVNSFMEIGL